MVLLKRAYEPAHAGDGQRFLVERLWPRGVKKDSLRIAGWLREVAPSTELRQWFGHDPAKWNEFRRRYFAELDTHRDTLQPLRDAARQGKVTLVYSSHDREHNNAVALKEYLESKLTHLHPHRKRAA
jgi:uncharacterized protein YeaO (DUF488 family)